MVDRKDLPGMIVKIMPALFRFAMRLSRNKDRASDLVQETAVRALEHLDSFDPDTNLSAWLFVILRNRYFQEQKKLAREVSDPELLIASNRAACTSETAGRDLEIALELLRDQPVIYREAFTKVVFGSTKYTDAAAEIGVPVGTVKSRVHRVRYDIKKEMRVG
jgi:RNA polymerase sigma-70 factor, ECF subfamily